MIAMLTWEDMPKYRCKVPEVRKHKKTTKYILINKSCVQKHIFLLAKKQKIICFELWKFSNYELVFRISYHSLVSCFYIGIVVIEILICIFVYFLFHPISQWRLQNLRNINLWTCYWTISWIQQHSIEFYIFSRHR